MEMLALEKLRKVFTSGGRTEVAVEGIDLAIGQGEFVSLLGPSGCGKTTTLRCVAGLERPSSGTIRIAGIDRTGSPPQQRNIGMCFQEATVYPHMSIRRNLDYPLKLARIAAAERAIRVADMALVLKLESMLEKVPSQLSGGQRQRAALGRALIRKPALFLLDEPMSSLDAKLKVEMRKELKIITGLFNTTTLYVTHDQEEAMALSDRICVMNGGRIEQFDTPEMVYRKPATTFVATFIGVPAMNIIPCKREGTALVSVAVGTGTAGTQLWSECASANAGLAAIGIRPEDLRVAPAPGAGTIAMRVVLVEILGERTIVHLTGPFGEMRATLYGISHVHAGQTVHVGLNAAAVHWFDDAGRRLRDEAH